MALVDLTPKDFHALRDSVLAHQNETLANIVILQSEDPTTMNKERLATLKLDLEASVCQLENIDEMLGDQ